MNLSSLVTLLFAIFLTTNTFAQTTPAGGVPSRVAPIEEVDVVLDPRLHRLQKETDTITNRCEDFSKYVRTRTMDLSLDQASLLHFAKTCVGRSCFNMDELKKSAAKPLADCHDAAVKMALTPKSACYYTKLKRPGETDFAFKKPVDFCAVLTSIESAPVTEKFFASVPDKDNGQCIHIETSNRDNGLLGRLLLENDACVQDLISAHFRCTDDRDEVDHYLEGVAYLKKTKDEIQVLSSSVVDGCTIANAADAEKTWSTRTQESLKCLTNLNTSCALAQQTAEAKEKAFTDETANNSVTCAFCATPKVTKSDAGVIRKPAAEGASEKPHSVDPSLKGTP